LGRFPPLWPKLPSPSSTGPAHPGPVPLHHLLLPPYRAKSEDSDTTTRSHRRSLLLPRWMCAVRSSPSSIKRPALACRNPSSPAPPFFSSSPLCSSSHQRHGQSSRSSTLTTNRTTPRRPASTGGTAASPTISWTPRLSRGVPGPAATVSSFLCYPELRRRVRPPLRRPPFFPEHVFFHKSHRGTSLLCFPFLPASIHL
jgi:hypothetical protein